MRNRRPASKDIRCGQSFDYKGEISGPPLSLRARRRRPGRHDRRQLEEHPGIVLNVGCGPWGHKLAALAAHGRSLTAVDREIEAIRQARAEVPSAGFHTLVGHAHDLPFRASTFDHVLALGLFAHIDDPLPVFNEIRRVCRRGARVFITNAVRHARSRYEQTAAQTGFDCVHAEEGYCPAASGNVKQRYLLVLQRTAPDS